MTSPRLIPMRNLMRRSSGAGFAVDHRPLQFHGTAHRVDDAREFRQHAIAGILDDAAGMLADLRVEELAAMRLEALVCALLVRPHQPRILDDIGAEDCRQPPLDPFLRQYFAPLFSAIPGDPSGAMHRQSAPRFRCGRYAPEQTR